MADAVDRNALGLERIMFFSDAVMAIAITLLAIDLKVPQAANVLTSAEVLAQLNEMSPDFASFVISFVVIGIYWTSHHRYFGYIRRYDGGLMLLNMLFLLFITLMPFVASFLAAYQYLPLGVSVYAGEVALIGYTMGILWRYATIRHRLVDADLDARFIRTRNWVALVIPTLFVISIPLAWIDPQLSILCWWTSPLVMFAISRLASRKSPVRHAA